MKRILFAAVLGIALFSCEKKTENTMTVSGNIKGLKKGSLYLQHFGDSTLITLDSLHIKGDGTFTFSHEVPSPEVFYLYLKKKDNNDINDRITFFGEPGDIHINTSWNTVDTDVEIIGSKSQEKLEEFTDMMSNFNLRSLELIQQMALPEVKEDSVALDSLQRLSNKNLVNRYRFTLNFGLLNSDSFVTPYLMLYEAREANPKYLDSVYNSLSPDVAASRYGIEFKKFMDKEAN